MDLLVVFLTVSTRAFQWVPWHMPNVCLYMSILIVYTFLLSNMLAELALLDGKMNGFCE